MQLKSYVQGRWHAGDRDAQVLRDATTGLVIAEASSSGIDFAGVLEHARRKGGPALRQLTFHERAALLKRIAKLLTDRKDEFYALSYATGATKADSWIDIDGGIGTLFAYASRGARELPNSRVYVDGEVEVLSKSGTFIGQHICVPLEGAAIHINAFNFPVWGMLEKLAPTLLAGVPAIVKPATTTAYLTELVVDASSSPASCRKARCNSSAAAWVTRSIISPVRTSSRSRARRALRRSCARIRASSRTRCVSSARPTRSTHACSAPTPRRANRSSIRSCARSCAR